MTDAELITAIQGELSLLESGAQWSLTVLTGYLLIAFIVGSRLTRFQVSFVNTVFILILTARANSNWTSNTIVNDLLGALYKQNPELALQFGYVHQSSLEVLWIRPLLLAAIVIGALLFMWQIRHPKKE